MVTCDFSLLKAVSLFLRYQKTKKNHSREINMSFMTIKGILLWGDLAFRYKGQNTGGKNITSLCVHWWLYNVICLQMKQLTSVLSPFHRPPHSHHILHHSHVIKGITYILCGNDLNLEHHYCVIKEMSTSVSW